MIPDSNMCSNSWRAIRRRSGARHRAREETGGPVVLMWWVTVCLGGGGRRLQFGEVGEIGKESRKLIVGVVREDRWVGCGYRGRDTLD